MSVDSWYNNVNSKKLGTRLYDFIPDGANSMHFLLDNLWCKLLRLFLVGWQVIVQILEPQEQDRNSRELIAPRRYPQGGFDFLNVSIPPLVTNDMRLENR